MRTCPTPATRSPNDLYPTTPEAALVLGMFLEERHPYVLDDEEQWFDPTAGFGTLPEWAGVPFENRWAHELSRDPLQVAELERRIPSAHLEVGVDALTAKWTRANIMANFPFCILDPLVEKAIAFHEAGTAFWRPIVCLLTPVQFWHASSRKHLRRPDWKLEFGWRPNFSAGYKVNGEEGSGPSQDYVWAIYDGSRETGYTRSIRVERPTVPRELVLEHERLARMAVGLPGAKPMPLFDFEESRG